MWLFVRLPRPGVPGTFSGPRRGRPRLSRIALGLACWGLAGCGISPSYVDRAHPEDTPAAAVVDPVEYQVHDSFRQDPPKCIAVLPFRPALEDLPDGGTQPAVKPEEAELVRRAFHAQLAPHQWRGPRLGRIDTVLGASAGGQQKDLRALGRALDCDALMTGTVTRRNSSYFALYSRVSVGAEVRIVRARDGAVLWEGRHQAVSHGGVVPISFIGAAFGAVDAALNMQGEQIERVTDDLARRLVSTIPDDADYRLVNTEVLNLRGGPGTRYPVRQKLPRAARLAVLDADADHDWLTVQTLGGQLGYVPARYLTAAPARNMPEIRPEVASPAAPPSS